MHALPLPQPTIEAHGTLRFYSAASITVTAGDARSEHKICQIAFSRRDGSIFASFPYLSGKRGLLSVAVFPPGHTGKVEASFGEAARSTSHLVKYSHHPDGKAHFSQDGLIRNEVRRQSFRLDGPIGYVFQLHAYRPRAFASHDASRKKAGRLVL